MKTSQPGQSATESTQASSQRGGLGPGSGTALAGSTGQRLPVPPRERKPALAALAVLLILGGALTSAYLVIVSGERVSAIRVAQPVAAGQQIPATALEEVQIGDTGIEYISWSERDRVTDIYAAVPLVQGALLTNNMVAETDEATEGRVIVGLALQPGQLPSRGLRPGQRVTLYAVGGQGGGGGIRPGTTLAEDAIVQDAGQRADDALRAGQTTVSVAVPPEQAPRLAQAASAGSVAVALVPPGTTVEGQGAAPRPGGNEPGAGTGSGRVSPPASQPASEPAAEPAAEPASSNGD